MIPIPALATGGAFGDGLFFFCSGFTLFMGRGGDFFNWYKRRINRIYPSLLSWAVIACILFDRNDNIINVLIWGGGPFILAIMIFYIGLHFFRKIPPRKLALACGIYILVVIGLYTIQDHSEVLLYKTNRWYTFCHYFVCMLMGAIVGLKRASLPKPRAALSAILLVISAIAYFGLLFVCKKYPSLTIYQILSLIPYWAFIYFTYRFFSSAAIVRLYDIPVVQKPVYYISALCLEIYLVQFSIITDRMNHLFPLNLLIVFAAIVAMAFAVKVLGNFISQTFRDDPYDWRRMIRL